LFKKILKFVRWPALCGLLAAVILLQWNGVLAPATQGIAVVSRGSYATAVERAVPSVVSIYTARIPSRRNPLFNDPVFRRFSSRERVQKSLGSGVIVSADGLILTNQHVISGADEIVVSLHDGREGLARVVGSDADTDLALLKIELENIQPIKLGKPEDARVGDVVLAIGNPFGFGHSVSQGIISALGRWGLNLSRYEDFIQTDAAINLGNSGGALVNTRGELLGINTATFSQANGASTPIGGAIGIGLAIPADLAMSVIQDLLTYGKVIRGWMGIEVRVLDASTSGQPTAQQLQVTGLAPAGPAAQAGLQIMDIITHIDNQPIQSGHETMNRIAMLRPGDRVGLNVLRQGQLINLDAIVGIRPSQ
jgi:serine protease DegS